MIAFVLADSTGSTQADYSMIESLGAGKGAFFKGEIKPRSGSLKTSNDLCFFAHHYACNEDEGKQYRLLP